MKDEGEFPEITAGQVLGRPGPSGFLDHARVGETSVLDVAGKNGFSGVCMDVLYPEDTTERFPVAGRIVSAAVREVGCERRKALVEISSRATTDDLEAQYRILCAAGAGDQILAEVTVAVTGEGWMASLGLALPFAVGSDPLNRRTTVGGETRDEVWRLDQNDEDTSEEWQRRVSDKRARWPLWRIGGLLADAPHHYLIWKSSDVTTPSLPMDQGTVCPGWVSYADQRWGIRLSWTDIQRHTPAGITVDSVMGIIWIWLHPPAVRPVKIRGTVTRSAQLAMDFHAI